MPGPLPKTAPPDGAREALLDATITRVRRLGWAATSLDQVCRLAGVTKGGLFHHFGSKEGLGVAAAQRWGELTSALFRSAPYQQTEDPLDRLFAYLDFRAELATGLLEAFTCFAGTTVQETFASSEAISAASGKTISDHAALLATDFEGAIAAHPPREPVTAESLATYTQTVIQGAFVLAKVKGDAAPVHDALAHLKRYLAFLFGKSPSFDQSSDKE